jgi:pyruvate/2-oxoglutarate dehydrogenase complex dihydrolipoamide dehydrogenase (E3) component
MATYDADVAILGAGPGGYVAAIRAGQLAKERGGTVVCIEREFLGGTCLNWGCIPSKAMIAHAERYQHVLHASEMGIQIEGAVRYDFAQMQARKDKIVQTLRNGIATLFKKHNVQLVQGTGRLTDPHTTRGHPSRWQQAFHSGEKYHSRHRLQRDENRDSRSGGREYLDERRCGECALRA